MKILFAASEALPYFKTGGLGDVLGSLPKCLAANGHDVAVVIPYFRSLKDNVSAPWSTSRGESSTAASTPR